MMNKFKQLLLPTLVLAIILSSCTINHPLYTSNYHIEWKTFKHSSNKQTLSNNNAQNKIHSQNNRATAITSEQADTLLNRNTDIHENNIASTDGSLIILPAKKFDLSKTMAALTKKTNATNYASETKTKIDHKKLNPLKKNYHKIRKTKGILKALYLLILVLVLGALALFFISLFGIFFLLAAITAGIIILIFGTLVILGL